MESYIKPTLKSKLERIIIHCGTDDLKNNTSQSIAENILSLAKSSQQENNIVLVSFIVPRKDHLDKKGKEVNIMDSMLFNIVVANSDKKCLLKPVRQLL